MVKMDDITPTNNMRGASTTYSGGNEMPKAAQKLTREQKRFQQRTSEEAMKTLNILGDKLLDAFTISDDPEGEEMVKMFDRVDAQWRTYCKRKQLIPGIYSAMREYANSLLLAYQNSQKESVKMDDFKGDVAETMVVDQQGHFQPVNAPVEESQASGDLEYPVQNEVQEEPIMKLGEARTGVPEFRPMELENAEIVLDGETKSEE